MALVTATIDPDRAITVGLTNDQRAWLLAQTWGAIRSLRAHDDGRANRGRPPEHVGRIAELVNLATVLNAA